MYKICFIVLAFIGFVNAQNVELPGARVLHINKTIDINHIALSAQNALLGFVEPNQTLQAELVKKSKLGYHIHFNHYFENVPVFGSSIKLNITLDGRVINIVNNLQSFTNTPSFNLTIANNETPCWWVNNGFAIAAKQVKFKDELGVNMLSVYTNLPQPILTQTLDLFNKKDTLVQTKVFNPDPLTTAQKHYGDDNGLYKNHGGRDTAALNNERKLVPITLKHANDTFYAENKYVVILDMEPPIIAPFRLKTSDFDFTRAQPIFRELMCLYHIETFNNYLNSLGLDSVMQTQTNVDPHGYQGQDQSRFSVEGFGPALYFGTGGVPDAEDADVIIHEYMHAIGYAIAPNTTSGNQRLAIEEANCDVMATQYSKAVSNFEWRNVFNWDGFNEFWNGRKTDTNKKYPNDVVSDFYKTAEIWSSMLNDLGEDIGRDVLTQLIVNSIYFYQSNINMQQAADFLLLTDSLLFNFSHFDAMQNRYVQRGFAVNHVGIGKENWFDKNVVLLNTQGFAIGNENAMVESLGTSFNATIFAANGSLIKEYNNAYNLQLNPADFDKGLYVLTLKNSFGTKTYKLMRF